MCILFKQHESVNVHFGIQYFFLDLDKKLISLIVLSRINCVPLFIFAKGHMSTIDSVQSPAGPHPGKQDFSPAEEQL